MVYLSKIYTKTGDDGTTALGDGTRVPKDDPRIEAYGTVDELNTVIGLVLSTVADVPERPLLESISNDLFDVGADLCVPEPVNEAPNSALRITSAQVERLEKAIDRLNEPLEPLRSFILPGGTPSAAWFHLCRTVCRRAERHIATLSRVARINTQVTLYLNRLSDLFFVLARVGNQRAGGDILWKPGQNR